MLFCQFHPLCAAHAKINQQLIRVLFKQAERFARYVRSFRNELLALTHACGYEHPSEFTGDDVEISTGPAQFKSLRELEGYTPKRRAYASAT